RGQTTEADLKRVQRRREFPTRATQRVQVFIQNRLIGRVLGARGPLRPPLLVRLLSRWPFLRRFPARLVGLGVRREHIATPAAPAATRAA
ncbi:MAG: hypothetical protein ACREE1_10540, partial [Stellaceae bacterium]